MKLISFKTLVLSGVLSISGAASSASAGQRLHVNVPFAFSVGGQQLAAGEYRVEQADNGMIILQGQKSGAMVLSLPADTVKPGATSLRFTSSASQTFLTGVQVEGEMSRSIPLHNDAARKVTITSAR